jgi:hypothetical protein
VKKLLSLLALGLPLLTGCPQKDPTEHMGMQSPQELIKTMFESPDPDMRRGAICELASHGYGLQESYLKGYAAIAQRDSDPSVRCAALRALGSGGNARYIAPAIAALQDPNPTVRQDAAIALDSMVDAQATGPLCDRSANDTSTEVRCAAAKALRHYRQPGVVDVLVAALSDAEFCVRFQARNSLREITGLDGGHEPAAWRKLLAEKTPATPASPPASQPAPATIKL